MEEQGKKNNGQIVKAQTLSLQRQTSELARRGLEEIARLEVESVRIVTEIAGIKMVSIPGGTFMMGSRLSEKDVESKFGIKSNFFIEHPIHTVTLDGFDMSTHEITVGTFRKFVDATGYKTDADKKGAFKRIYNGNIFEYKSDANWGKPYCYQNDNYPVTCVSWNDATAFCDWLSREKSHKFSLPTEAEWEYACRAGTETVFYTGNDENALGRAGWYLENSGKKAHPVGQKTPNAWGLYDMHGNVFEWCKDRLGDYLKSPLINPTDSGNIREGWEKNRMTRGGSWTDEATWCRSAFRIGQLLYNSNCITGFRIVRRPVKPKMSIKEFERILIEKRKNQLIKKYYELKAKKNSTKNSSTKQTEK